MEKNRELAPLQSRAAKIPVAKVLNKATRPPTSAEEAPVEAPVEAPAKAEPAPKKKASKKSQVTKPAPEKAPITLSLPIDLQGRARAAFRYAAFHEHVVNFSDLVANALEAEVKRIQDQYNNGEDFEPDFEPIARGRKSRR